MNHVHGPGREFEIGREGFSAEINAEERKTEEHEDDNEQLQALVIHGSWTIGDPSPEGNPLEKNSAR